MFIRASKRPLTVTLGLGAVILIASLVYVSTIFWRVSVAEKEQFGQSCLIPLTWCKRKYDRPATTSSFGDATYDYSRSGKVVQVHAQLINSFQHGYASALTAYELGAPASEFLFRVNEYLEAIFCRDAGTTYFYLDTKKDLFNNAIGRAIGVEARRFALNGPDADDYLVTEILTALNSKRLITHYSDPRVATLPSYDESGLPLLKEIQAMHGRSLN